MQRNLAQSCQGDGIDLAAGNGPRLDANIVRLTTGDGIDTASVQNPVLTRNLIQSVSDDGMEIDCEVACASALVQRNVVIGTLQEPGDGFNLGVAAPGIGTLRILNNTASRVGGEGFRLVMFDALVRGNVANRVGATAGDGFDLEGIATS